MKIRKGWYALFTFPLMFIFFVVVIIPFAIGIGFSFVEWDGLAKHAMSFVGFDNYLRVFTDARFLQSAGRTTVYTLISVVFVNVVGLIFALIVVFMICSKFFCKLSRINIVIADDKMIF